MDQLTSAVVSLAHLAYETAKAAKAYKEECVRIGERLMNLIVLAREWMDSVKKASTRNLPSHTALRSLEKILKRLNLTLQAATTPRSRWTSLVKTYMKSRDVLASILKAEKDLNSFLQDAHFLQGNMIYERIDHFESRFDRVEQVLLRLANQPDPSNPRHTYQEQMYSILNECQTKPPMLLSTEDTESTAPGSESLFTPSHEDVEDTTMDVKKLQCGFGSRDLIGEGSFSQVYRGEYDGVRVAVKRLKVHEVDLIKMSPEEKQRHIRRIQAEAVLMARSAIHPHILQVLGCHAVLDRTERPLMIMELMVTTFFLALHDDKIPLFTQRLELLKGIAQALEFLHLQGIVHRDVKSLNILLDGGRTTAKLSDFGEAKEKSLATTYAMTSTMITSGMAGAGAGAATGTMAYQAPEVLLQKVTVASRKAELHSYGVVLWEALTTDIPHRGKGPMQMLLLAQDSKHTTLLDIPSAVPNDHPMNASEMSAWRALRHVANACLARSPRDRPTASQAVQALGVGSDYDFLTDSATVEEEFYLENEAPTTPNHAPGALSQQSQRITSRTQRQQPEDPNNQTKVVGDTHQILTIERKSKHSGSLTRWEVFHNDKYLQKLMDGRRIHLQGVSSGDRVGLVVRGARHNLYVNNAPVSMQRLAIRLKCSEDVGLGFGGVSGKLWIEPCKKENSHLQQGFLSWSKA